MTYRIFQRQKDEDYSSTVLRNEWIRNGTNDQAEGRMVKWQKLLLW